MIVWFIQWFIVLIPVLSVATYPQSNKKCSLRWAFATFAIPLLLTWIAEIIVIVIEGGIMPYRIMYEYGAVPFWVWVISAWGMFYYFRYRFNHKGTCVEVENKKEKM